MINDFDKRKLRFLVMPIRFHPESKKSDAELAYICWKSVWGQAFKDEMNIKDRLYSDNYTRQSHVAVLFHNESPMALTTLNFINLTDMRCLDDSFFKVWPLETLNKLKGEAKSIMACCNVTVDFSYRKNALGISAKDLMLALQTRYLKSTSIDAVVAAVRLEKGMEKAAYRTGAYPLARDLAYTIPGQRVDIVCWHRDLDEDVLNPEIKSLSQYIWLNSAEVIDVSHNQGEKHAA